MRVVASIQANAEHATDEPLLSGWRAFLELCRDPQFRRIVLVDSPNVLGRERWNESPVTLAASEQLATGRIDEGRSASRLAVRMLMAALAEAALVIAESDDPQRASSEADEIVTRFIEALSRDGGIR